MREIKEVLVVGAGTMGHGFAQIFAMNHLSVWLVDEQEDFLKKARAWVMDNLNYMVELGEIGRERIQPTLSHIQFSTDLKQVGEKIVRYYQARFQIEFLYRDAKQFTGLNNCQARSKNKLDFHFNAALTAVNLAKHDWLTTKGNEAKPFSMSDYKTQYNNTLMLERFMCMFAINPNTAKNQKIVKELLDYGKIAA